MVISRLFGVALDPADDPRSLELKQAWMLREGEGTGDGLTPVWTLMTR